MKRLFLLLVMLNVFSVANAELPLIGEKEVVLYSANNQPLVIGKVIFTQQDSKVQYKIELEDEVFSNEFLSMRPFKCIHQGNKMLCYLVYPYEKQGFITAEDLTDLEYDLLFLHKGAAEYGINAWNGLYYKLEVVDEKIVGALHDVDLNVLVAPPEPGDLRPITEDMLYIADPGQRLYPHLEIK